MLQGETMRPTPTDLRLLSLGADGKRLDHAPTVTNAEATLAAIEAHLKKNEAQSIVDFDAHLDDPKLDWFVYPFPA